MTLTGCTSRTLDDFQDEGEGVIRKLIVELKQIRSRDDLPTHANTLKRLFGALVDVMIAAEKYKDSHPETDLVLPGKTEQSASDQLRIELNRVLHMEGGREVIKTVQEEALNRLEAFEESILRHPRK